MKHGLKHPEQERSTRLSRQVYTVLLLAACLGTCLVQGSPGDSRTLEFLFALSADPRSEFSARVMVLSPGRLVVAIAASAAPSKTNSPTVTAILRRPDETEAIHKQGPLPLRLEYLVNERELDQFSASGKTAWAVKLFNGGEPNRVEVRGVLRITVPSAPRLLVDTQFTLLGLSNSQEIPFSAPAPGKIQIDAEWETDATVSNDASPVSLSVSLIHPGTSKVHARRQNGSPVRIEHQVTGSELDAGARWIVRLQNDGQSKVRGKLQVTYTPAY